jgi:hypothetical protein
MKNVFHSAELRQRQWVIVSGGQSHAEAPQAIVTVVLGTTNSLILLAALRVSLIWLPLGLTHKEQLLNLDLSNL